MRCRLNKKRASSLPSQMGFLELQLDLGRLLRGPVSDFKQAEDSLLVLFSHFCEGFLNTSVFFLDPTNHVRHESFCRHMTLLLATTIKGLQEFSAQQDASTGRPSLVRLFREDISSLYDGDTLSTHLHKSMRIYFEDMLKDEPNRGAFEDQIKLHVDFLVDVNLTFLRLNVSIVNNKAPHEMKGLLAYLRKIVAQFEQKMTGPSDLFSSEFRSVVAEPSRPEIWCAPPDRKPLSVPVPEPAGWMRMVERLGGPIRWIQSRGRDFGDFSQIPVVDATVAQTMSYFAHVSASDLVSHILMGDTPFLNDDGTPFLYQGEVVTGKKWFEFKPPLPMFRLELSPGQWMVVALDSRVAAHFSTKLKDKGPVSAVKRLIGDTAFTNFAHKSLFKQRLTAESVHDRLVSSIIAAAKRCLGEMKGSERSRAQTIELFVKAFGGSVLGLSTIRNSEEISHTFGEGLRQVTTLTFQQLLGLVGAPAWFFPLPQDKQLGHYYRQIVNDNPHALVLDWRMARLLMTENKRHSANAFQQNGSLAILKELCALVRSFKGTSQLSKEEAVLRIQQRLKEIWPPSVIKMDKYSLWISKMAKNLYDEEDLFKEFDAGKIPTFEKVCASLNVPYSIESFLPYDLLADLIKKEEGLENVPWQEDPALARETLLRLYVKSEKRRLHMDCQNALAKLDRAARDPLEEVRRVFSRQNFDCLNHGAFIAKLVEGYPDFHGLESFDFEIETPPVLDRWIDISVRTFRMRFVDNLFETLQSARGQHYVSSLLKSHQTAKEKERCLEALLPRGQFNIDNYFEFLKLLECPWMLCRTSVQVEDTMVILERVKSAFTHQDFSRYSKMNMAERRTFLRQQFPVRTFELVHYGNPASLAAKLQTQFINYMSTDQSCELWERLLSQPLWEITEQLVIVSMVFSPILSTMPREETDTLFERELQNVELALKTAIQRVPLQDIRGVMKGFVAEAKAAEACGDTDAQSACEAKRVAYLKSIFPESEICADMVGTDDEKRSKYSSVISYLAQLKRQSWLKGLLGPKGNFKAELFRIFYSQQLYPIQYVDSRTTFLKDLIADRFVRHFYETLPKLAQGVLADEVSDELHFLHPNRKASIRNALANVACENKDELVDYLSQPNVLERLEVLNPSEVAAFCHSDFVPIVPWDHQLSPDELKAVMGVILAGSETSANAMITIFSQLTPEIKARLEWEIFSVIESTGKLVEELLEDEFTKMTDPSAAEGDQRGYRMFPETEAYILEVLACFPPAPAFVRLATEDFEVESRGAEPGTVNKFRIPSGSLCLVPVQELKRIYPNPKEHKSFTFADGGDPTVRSAHPRRCPGQFVASFELKVLLILWLTQGMGLSNFLSVDNIGVARADIGTGFTHPWGLDPASSAHRSESSASLYPDEASQASPSALKRHRHVASISEETSDMTLASTFA